MTALSIAPLQPFWALQPARKATMVLRRIRADDAAALQAFVRALSPTSRRLRFHVALNELPAATLHALTRVDQRAHVAFVLVSTENGEERIVGEARYVVADDGETAEFGIAVADACRGQGLADRLLEALAEAARAAGLRWLVGEVLADNARMRAFMCRRGFAETTRGVESGLVRVERCLDQPLTVAAAAGPWANVARKVHRLSALWLHRPAAARLDFRPF
jgi:acetyltransferase